QAAIRSRREDGDLRRIDGLVFCHPVRWRSTGHGVQDASGPNREEDRVGADCVRHRGRRGRVVVQRITTPGLAETLEYRATMKFAIVGAGAIGAFVGAMLAKSGEDVTLIARGAHLRAMQEYGVRVRGEIGNFDARVSATDDPAKAGPADVVLLTLKAHSLTAMAPRLAPLIAPETCVVSM